MSNTIPVSVYMITLNEEHTLPASLERMGEFQEVVIVDSGSTDKTVEVANRFTNTKVFYREWTGFSEQKAYAMSLCSNEWVLNVDADELLTPEYIQETRLAVSESGWDAMESRRTLLRWGRRPRNFNRDERLIRLFRQECGFYEKRRVHECISVNGSIRKSDATILHCEDLTYTERLAKANRYSQLRAEDKFEKGQQAHILQLLLIFPFSFVQQYFFKGNFLDGSAGLLTSMNAAFYAFQKYAKLREMHNLTAVRETSGNDSIAPQSVVHGTEVKETPRKKTVAAGDRDSKQQLLH